MGYSLSWLAVRKKTREQVHRALAMTSTGVFDDGPESRLSGAWLTGEWYLVVKNFDHFDDVKAIETLSVPGEVIACTVEEHVMFSGAAGWSNGRKIWSLTHDAQKGQDHLNSTGILPATFEGIRDRLSALKSGEPDVDYIFDIPIEVAYSITGYRHDAAVSSVDKAGFEVLHLAEIVPRDTWIKRWFK